MPFKPKYNIIRKIVATVIDYTLIFGFSIWYVLTFGTSNDDGSVTLRGTAALLPMIVWVVYFIIAERICSATFGHEIMKLKVVSIDGKSLSTSQIIKRRVCDAIEISSCFGLIAFFIAENNEKHQRLGDILAKTLVIGKNEGYVTNYSSQK